MDLAHLVNQLLVLPALCEQLAAQGARAAVQGIGCGGQVRRLGDIFDDHLRNPRSHVAPAEFDAASLAQAGVQGGALRAGVGQRLVEDRGVEEQLGGRRVELDRTAEHLAVPLGMGWRWEVAAQAGDRQRTAEHPAAAGDDAAQHVLHGEQAQRAEVVPDLDLVAALAFDLAERGDDRAPGEAPRVVLVAQAGVARLAQRAAAHHQVAELVEGGQRALDAQLQT
ncbi:hypothetical protein D3C81_1450830 [compost metagenome]